jgi:hypothetical protein
VRGIFARAERNHFDQDAKIREGRDGVSAKIPVPGFMPGTHVFHTGAVSAQTWMAGINPATGLFEETA